MKPYVILNAAMTLDGKIATKTGSSEILKQEVLRSQVPRIWSVFMKSVKKLMG